MTPKERLEKLSKGERIIEAPELIVNFISSNRDNNTVTILHDNKPAETITEEEYRKQIEAERDKGEIVIEFLGDRSLK